MSTAIVAFREGAQNVVVYEKRGIPTRQHWFDADPHTMQQLSVFGLSLLDIRMEINTEMPGYATIQCHVLERFLSLIALASGIQVQRHTIVDRLDSDTNSLVLMDTGDTVHTNNNQYSSAQFDILFICDGAHSPVRTTMPHVVSSYQNTFHLLPHSKQKITWLQQLQQKQNGSEGSEGSHTTAATQTNTHVLSQTSLILGFQLNPTTGQCPPFNASITAYDPSLINADDSRITAIFKRLYAPFCEVQVLFANKAFATPLALGRTYVDHPTGIPWELVRVGVNTFFTNKYKTVAQLKKGLINYYYKDKTNKGYHPKRDVKKHAVLFRMGILKTERAAYAHTTTTTGAGGIVVFRGDALVSAHYRLGIGINQAIQSSDLEVTALIKQYMFLRQRFGKDEGAVLVEDRRRINFELVERARVRARSRMEWMVQVQLFTLMFESYCNVVVDNSDLNALKILKKDYSNSALIEIGKAAILSLKCMQHFQLLP